MKKMMKKLLIILLMLISATILFAAVEGEETTTNPNVVESDNLIVTTSVDEIFIVKFTSATASDGTYADLGDSEPMIDDGDGTRSLSVRIQCETNRPGAVSLVLTGTALTRFSSNSPVSDDTQITLTATERDTANTTSFSTKAESAGIPSNAEGRLTLKEPNESTKTKKRTFSHIIDLEADMSEAIASNDYRAFLKVAVSTIE